MKFRRFLLVSFLLFGLISVIAAAVMMNLTMAWSEDETLKSQLQALSEPSNRSGVFIGQLADLPPIVRIAASSLAPGYAELEFPEAQLEAHILKRGLDDAASYTAIIHGEQGPALPVALVLVIWTVVCGLIALIGSFLLSRRLSRPVETLVASLTPGADPSHSDLAITELETLQTHIDKYRRLRDEQLIREASFNRTVSHEIRTPLATIKNSVELLAKEPLTEPVSQKVLRIERAASRLSDMVRVLLQIARDEHELRSNYVDFLTGLTEQVNQLRETGVEIEVCNQTAASARMGHDWPAALIVISALLDNAVAAAGKGPITVDFDETKFSVADVGPGMADHARDALENGKTLPGRLGFSVIHQVCERCRWRVGVDSDHRGTRIVVHL